MEGQCGLDATRGTGGRLQVADVGLHGTNANGAPIAATAGADHRGDALHLHLVANHSRRPVAFDQIHIDGINARGRVGPLERQPLPSRVGRRDALALAITRRTDALDHRVDTVAITVGVSESLEHKNARSLAHDKAVCIPIKGRRMIGGQRADLAELRVRRNAHRSVCTTGDAHVNIVALKCLYSCLYRCH